MIKMKNKIDGLLKESEKVHMKKLKSVFQECFENRKFEIGKLLYF